MFNRYTEEQADDLVSEYDWRGVRDHADAPQSWSEEAYFPEPPRRVPPWLPSTLLISIEAGVIAAFDAMDGLK